MSIEQEVTIHLEEPAHLTVPPRGNNSPNHVPKKNDPPDHTTRRERII